MDVYFLFSAASVVGLPSETFMAVLKRGSAGHDSVAIRVDQKSYSYVQLIASAWNISHLLCSQDLDSVSFFFSICLMPACSLLISARAKLTACSSIE